MATGPRELLSSSALDSDSFKVYCYKVVPCAKKFGHDWSECPFAHEGEKATRRCPALYGYSSIVCPDTRQGKACPRGDVCPYSHSIFEYWMHPARFRAQLCSFGTDCNRRICFFAHTQEQLRIPSEPVIADALASRAPYLQGRVAPASRYALYPEQVPSLVPMQNRLMTAPQQPQVLGQSDMSSMQGLPQVVYVTTGGPQAMAMPAPGQQALPAGQQWAAAPGGSSNVMLIPAGQAAAAPGGMGYYVQAGTAGPAAQEYTPGTIVASGMQVLSNSYGGAQPVQLLAMPGDASVSGYPVAAAAGMTGTQMAYAPVYASPSGVQMQHWGMADDQQQQVVQQPQQHSQRQPQLLSSMVAPRHQQRQQPQPALQLVAPEDAGSAGAACAEAGTYIIATGGQMAAARGPLEATYALMPSAVVQGNVAAGPAGLMQQQGRRSSVPGGARSAAVESTSVSGAAGVDDLAQQMAGWGIQ